MYLCTFDHSPAVKVPQMAMEKTASTAKLENLNTNTIR